MKTSPNHRDNTWTITMASRIPPHIMEKPAWFYQKFEWDAGRIYPVFPSGATSLPSIRHSVNSKPHSWSGSQKGLVLCVGRIYDHNFLIWEVMMISHGVNDCTTLLGGMVASTNLSSIQLISRPITITLSPGGSFKMGCALHKRVPVACLSDIAYRKKALLLTASCKYSRRQEEWIVQRIRTAKVLSVGM